MHGAGFAFIHSLKKGTTVLPNIVIAMPRSLIIKERAKKVR